VSRELAKRLDFSWVSTGAFYRGLAFVALKKTD
jgi:cytidylate kinase